MAEYRYGSTRNQGSREDRMLSIGLEGFSPHTTLARIKAIDPSKSDDRRMLADFMHQIEKTTTGAPHATLELIAAEFAKKASLCGIDDQGIPARLRQVIDDRPAPTEWR